ncbi:MAG: hypothetical protein IJB65_02385 [Clostridia bacterium]|nr:hypothetical protein [Clostridia bacterium]
MDTTQLFDKFYVFLMSKYRSFCCNKSNKHYRKLLKMHNIPYKKLSKQQKEQIDNIYKGFGKYDYNTHRLVYSTTNRFDPYIMPEKLFRTEVELKLNSPSFKNAWSDKSYFDFFFPDVKFVNTIYRNIAGVLFDKDFNKADKQEAITFLQQLDSFVIKPSIDNGIGKGVRLVKKGEDLDKVLASYGKDYVIQEVFRQHSTLSQFNKSSVNIVRYISLMIDGEVYPVMAALRCGAEGSFNDNCITEDGMGMFVIGIDNDGKLKSEAFHSCGKKINRCPNGTEFNGVTIPSFDKMTKIVKNVHKYLGHFGFVGWDFVVDENGTPAIMEYNIKGPGVLYYQYANGPLLGKYTQTVLDYCKNKKKL